MSLRECAYLGCVLYLCVTVHSISSESTIVSQGREMVEGFYDRFSSREVDLVFILDRSSSVPRSGWEAMLNFVRSLLEFFTLSHDNTRIAIISFSTRVSIDINDLDEGRESKCSMMLKIQLRLGQKVMSGYTATNEALRNAKAILLNSRRGAKKAVFVLTDGKSNIGPAPVQASIELRSLRWDTGWNTTAHGPQLEIYAFGVKDAYMPELRTLASPLSNHTYFLPDFRTFEELARSLHNDEQRETWDVVSNMMLCENQCSANAVCTCTTRSGQYLCVCKAGYYGNGFTCAECPLGTYKDTLSPHLCVPCPSNSTTLLPGAINHDQCVCQPPYHQDSVRKTCQLRSCPELPEIAHAHKFNVIGRIRDEVIDTGSPCYNTPETSCHYKCDVGYRLGGHPGLICNMNGTWSGQVPQCQVVDCRTLDYHGDQVTHGEVSYVNSTTTYLSVVHVRCDEGWRLFGRATRQCTTNGIWSDRAATCIEAHCPAIQPPPGGAVEGVECSMTRQLPGTVCTLSCRAGYTQTGPRRRTCSSHGTWDTVEDTICVDTESPTISCPPDIRTPVTTANYAIVHWDAESPQYSDNSGDANLRLLVIGLRTSPAHLTVGYHQINYQVQDAAGNEAFCTRGIHVVEKIIRMDFCPENILKTDVIGSGQVVNWTSPVFRDNNNNTIPLSCSIPNGSVFPIGTRNVRCTPQDTVQNLPICVFSVTLEGVVCHHPREPLHGSVTCSQSSDALTLCSVKCNSNYDFYRQPQLIYRCLNGQWALHQRNTWWPDCSRTRHPSRARMKPYAEYFYYGGACEQKKNVIARKFEEWIQSRSWQVCGSDSCPLDDIKVSCGVDSRRRREVRLPGYQTTRSRDSPSGQVYFEKIRGIKNGQFEVNSQGVSRTLLKVSGGSRTRQKRNSKAPDTFPNPKERHFPIHVGKRNLGSMLVNPTVFMPSGGGETYADNIMVDEPNPGAGAGASTTVGVPYVTSIHDGTTDKDNGPDALAADEPNDGVEDDPLPVTMPRSGDETTSLRPESQSTDFASSQPTSQEYSTRDNSLPTTPSVQSTTSALPTNAGDSHVTVNTPSGNTTERVKIQFTLTLSSNITDMTIQEQLVVTDLLYNIADNLGHLLNESRLVLDNSSDVLLPAARMSYAEPQFDDCEPGFITRDSYSSKTCIMCPVGTYNANRTCTDCPVGQFQDQEGQLECQQCPDNTTTMAEGASNSTDCRTPCTPGYISSSGLAPCIPCPTGTYQVVLAARTCQDCPTNMSTLHQGSDSVGQCQHVCLPGSYGQGGIEPCELCPLDSYQPQGGSTDCLLCPGKKMANVTGAISEDQCLDYDPCLSNATVPCENGGQCVSVSQNGTMCVCPAGYIGSWCETEVLECVSSPCINNGTCTEGVGNFTCNCSSGYTGIFCELDIDACISSPCQNGGSCRDLEGANGYSCYCQSGYLGDNCEQLDECHEYNCYHGYPFNDGGICRCNCQGGFAGVYCDILIDLCLTFPCQNSRKCRTFQNDFECDCLPGYVGKQCSFEIDECASSPCQNGGTCFDRVNGYYCNCPGGFIGDHCQGEVNADFDLVFAQRSSYGFVSMEREVIPALTAVSVCTWVRTSQVLGSGTIFSYTIPGHEGDGIIVPEFGLSDDGVLKLSLRQESVSSSVTLAPNVWQHVCVTWRGDGGAWNMYINGTRQAAGVGLAMGYELIGGGTLVIGQQQNTQGNIFNFWESFIGEISQFNIYGEPLSEDQITVLANQSKCDMSYGSVLSWTQVVDGIYGHVLIRNRSRCLDVNECKMTDNYPCRPNHICEDMIGGYNCSRCQYGYQGDDCDEPIDECLLGICQNGSSCTDGPDPWDLACHCLPGYTGANCQNTIDYCESNPCLNSAVCVSRVGGYECECRSINTGPHCEDLGSSCWPNPCQNGGACSSIGDTFNCNCPEGYNGTRCEIHTRRCRENPCQNGGACTVENGRHVCYCNLHWKGHRCEVKVVTDCSLAPCVNGGTCEAEDSDIGYICHCPTRPGVLLDSNCGYVSPCDAYPCFDRGVCVSMPNNTFMCDCNLSYSGRQCEIDGTLGPSTPTTYTLESTTTDLCSQSVCYNGGTCVEQSGVCVCPMEYTGARCQVQKHTVLSSYEGQVTILMPYTTRNRQTVLADFSRQVEHVMSALKSTGQLDITIKSLRPSADKSEMVAEFEATYTQYVTSMTEKIGYMTLRNVLHDAVSSGHVGNLQTSIKGFHFQETLKPDSMGKDRTDHMTIYLSLGLVCTTILMVFVIAWVVCKIRRRRKRRTSINLIPSMNNAPAVNMTMLTNPVFDHSDEDHRRAHGSMTEDNTYAEFGETIIPYEVTYSTKQNLKECNLVRAAARKNSEVSFSTPPPTPAGKDKGHDSAKPLLDKDYLSPVVSKNELSQMEEVPKDEKKLLPNLGKNGHGNPAFDQNDYLEPVKSCPKPNYVKQPQDQTSGYANEGHNENVGQGEQSQMKGLSEGEANRDQSPNSHQYLDMKVLTEKDKMHKLQFVNESETGVPQTTSLSENPSSPIDRLAYMINKPVRGEITAEYIEPIHERPPEYLDICPPKPSELPQPDLSKRKLPPLPKGAGK
ncbi:sushi, von Willebrand factor type A, EGF and pentraxin domain-containing protein 1-like isoform X1 [Haliotis rubra]|uniref:sushi, von Willebrand factor type A, EGF and pentraxin domain-containing protein 1-like isoform X1 n=1 Tax=Haliotis rubra TaxID=36100 RepID=UPI001EE58783|nr:sushi, von Willebrand factor type A, EGF and pentraxin domain-containing protein 1-like isoform X1 [Haliotis rubra]XP_046553001.1 sushi, von Willebrand factor type A, EGF and pentraxin domain-containing protein 1-like isoform X1 [Haliotis rubra]